MKKLIIFILVAGSFPCSLQADDFLKSRVDERMELLCIVMQLAGMEEYYKGMIPEYNREVDKFFTAYKNEPVVATAQKMKRKYGCRRDAVFSLAVHLKIEGDSVFFDPALTDKGMDSRANNKLTATFIKELNDFYKKTDAGRFFSSCQALYRSFGEETDRKIVDTIHYKWFDDFLGWHASDHCIIPTLLIRDYYFYASTIDREGKEVTYFSIRGFLNQNKRPSSDWKMARSAILRGIAHTYVNPLIDKYLAELKPYVKPIYNRMWINEDTGPYDPVEIVLYEGFARGIELLYAQTFEDSEEVIREQKRRGYFWLEGFADLLVEYANNREEYKTLKDFMPKIVRFYKELSE